MAGFLISGAETSGSTEWAHWRQLQETKQNLKNVYH
jgi:hypothetical protein